MIRKKEPASMNKILQIPAEHSTKLLGENAFEKKTLQLSAKTFFFRGLHLISGKKHFNLRRRPFFFGLHSISATELRNLH